MKTEAEQTAIKQKSDPKYKDTLFRTLFRDKERAIELCNAVAGTNYTKDASVIMCDLDNSLLKRYNDLAFAFEDQLIVMYEHQSTINPNMPLRFLSYIIDLLFSWFIDISKIYGRKLQKLPTPQFYVLYNGKDELKHNTLKLSDAFRIKPTEPFMELTVKVLDVNHESNNEVLSRSASLGGYSYLIAQIRRYESKGAKRDEAIKKAIKKCINEGILVDFLKENFKEVANMLAWEYDQAAEFKVIWEEGREEGREEGIEKTKIETAVEMVKDGLNVDKIAAYIKMPIEWVKEVTVNPTV